MFLKVYLRELGRVMIEANESSDPRVLELAPRAARPGGATPQAAREAFRRRSSV